jgi:hypothetical protein
VAQWSDAQDVEYGFGYEPGAYIGNISPTPLLIVAIQDHLAVSDLAIEAYEQAYEPKKLVLLPGGHFDAYVDEFHVASAAACEWFAAHLGIAAHWSRRERQGVKTALSVPLELPGPAADTVQCSVLLDLGGSQYWGSGNQRVISAPDLGYHRVGTEQCGAPH